MTSITIIDHELPDYTHNLYDVVINDDVQIRTIVTNTPSFVDDWINETVNNNNNNNNSSIIVGLDIEWRPNFRRNDDFPVAVIQLCVGLRCLIFQIKHSPVIPHSLAGFLNDPAYTFVGVGIDSDIEKLIDDYNLTVANPVDLGKLAALRGASELRNAGLKTLAMRFLGLEVEKPKKITMSRWDDEWLKPAQVQYACLDAYLSSEIGRSLNAGGQ